MTKRLSDMDLDELFEFERLQRRIEAAEAARLALEPESLLDRIKGLEARVYQLEQALS